MRALRFHAGAAALILLATLAGCGGGGDAVGGTTTVDGVWTGAQTRAADGTIEYDFTRNGNDVTGTARVTTASGAVYVGSFTGTVNGANVDVTVTWNQPAGYGTTHFTGTQNNSQLSGTYTHTPAGGAPETGSVTLTKSSATTPTNLAGTYNGTSTDVKNGSTSNISITFTQSGNSLSGTVTVSSGGLSVTGTVSATVIGDHLTLGAVDVGGHAYTFDANVSGHTISGTSIRTDDPTHHGPFSVTEAS